MEEKKMLCPICGNEMEQYKDEPSRNSKTGKQYQRTFYRCVTDDTWGRYEIPIEPMSSIDPQKAEEAETAK